MGRRAEGRTVTVDYTVWTVDLSREELMIILNGQRTHRINRAKRMLQRLRALRERNVKRRPNAPVFWRRHRREQRKHIDGWQQELPLF